MGKNEWDLAKKSTNIFIPLASLLYIFFNENQVF